MPITAPNTKEIQFYNDFQQQIVTFKQMFQIHQMFSIFSHGSVDGKVGQSVGRWVHNFQTEKSQ